MNKITKISAALLLLLVANNAFAQRFLTQVFNDNQIIRHTNVQYGQNYEFFTNSNGAVITQTMNVYEPDPNVDTLSNRPVVIYIHTGNFLPPILNGSPNGSINDSSAAEICRQYAKRGFVVLAPSYRLGWLPTALDAEVRRSTLLQAVYRGIQDIKTTVRFIRKNAAENGNTYKIDPDRIVLYGDGTGGYVALAYNTLDDFLKLLIPKFINQNTQQPYVDTITTGNIEGFGGTKNIDNHVGYSSKINMIINTGGALADTTWMSAGQAPVVSFQTVRDPFAPYTTGIVIVPTTNEPVVEVSGAGVFQRINDQLGNNCAFDTVTYTDPYSIRAASLHNQVVAYMDQPFTINTGTGSGLFPFMRPLAAQRLQNEGSPWQYWDSVALAALGQQAINAHINSKQSNPDMSKAKALAYIDTIMGFSTPRIYRVLNLGNLSGGVFDCNAINSVFNNTKGAAAVSMYPNPASTVLHIELKGTEGNISNVHVFDITGKTALAEKVFGERKTFSLNTAMLVEGVYFINVQLNNGERATQKVIIQ
jgi:hypothetical protein